MAYSILPCVFMLWKTDNVGPSNRMQMTRVLCLSYHAPNSTIKVLQKNEKCMNPPGKEGLFKHCRHSTALCDMLMQTITSFELSFGKSRGIDCSKMHNYVYHHS